ncbi:LOW QUALITY PROTEIN: hypothetical protein U9M48_003673 [Paspalum notatum var. saurae]|uniref:Uncharacterized protein n=1 Tax=Paspalum notatum var. saurae TaxID=547442 RepID=A0AAQ3PLZ5_PASNO
MAGASWPCVRLHPAPRRRPLDAPSCGRRARRSGSVPGAEACGYSTERLLVGLPACHGRAGAVARCRRPTRVAAQLLRGEVKVACACLPEVALAVLRCCGHSARPSSGAVATARGMARRTGWLAGAAGIRAHSQQLQPFSFRGFDGLILFVALRTQGAGGAGSRRCRGANGGVPVLFLLHELAARGCPFLRDLVALGLGSRCAWDAASCLLHSCGKQLLAWSRPQGGGGGVAAWQSVACAIRAGVEACARPAANAGSPLAVVQAPLHALCPAVSCATTCPRRRGKYQLKEVLRILCFCNCAYQGVMESMPMNTRITVNDSEVILYSDDSIASVGILHPRACHLEHKPSSDRIGVDSSPKRIPFVCMALMKLSCTLMLKINRP